MDSFASGPSTRRHLRIAWMLPALICMIGCQDYRGPVSINSDDPDLKILAIKQDAAGHSTQDVPTMVLDLQSDDAAIRFYSIEALRKITHDDFGYHYYENDDQRAPALSRWQNWLKQQKLTASAR